MKAHGVGKGHLKPFETRQVQSNWRSEEGAHDADSNVSAPEQEELSNRGGRGGNKT